MSNEKKKKKNENDKLRIILEDYKKQKKLTKLTKHNYKDQTTQ